MSQYKVEPYVLDTEAEPKYTFAEIKWGKIVAIHHHWCPLEEFCKFFEANAFFIDITDVLIDGEPPAIGDSVTNDPNTGYKIIHIRQTYTWEERVQYAIDKLKLVRDQKELEDIEYKGIPFDADALSQDRMDKARKFLEDSGAESITWTTADNQRVDVTVEDFKNINILIAMRSDELHKRYNQLKEYILSLEEGRDDILDMVGWYFVLPVNQDSEVNEDGGTGDEADA